MNELLAYLGIAFIRLLALLPLAWIRAVGKALGILFFHTIRSRRHIATVNLKLCFPALSDVQIQQLVREHFVYFMQTLLDRSWLWHGNPQVTLQRLKITGAVNEFRTTIRLFCLCRILLVWMRAIPRSHSKSNASSSPFTPTNPIKPLMLGY